MAYNRKENQRISLDIPKNLYQQIKKLAEESDRSTSAMIRVLISFSLSKERK